MIAFLVAPALLGTLCTALLLRFRPAAIPLWSVWVAVALQMVVWVSTATIQLPMQLELAAHGYSAPLVERLIETNWWLRRLPYAACAVVFLWMAARWPRLGNVSAPRLLVRSGYGMSGGRCSAARTAGQRRVARNSARALHANRSQTPGSRAATASAR